MLEKFMYVKRSCTSSFLLLFEMINDWDGSFILNFD